MESYNILIEKLISSEKCRKNNNYNKNEDNLKTYYNIGKLIVEDGVDSDSKIKEYYNKLDEDIRKKYSLFNFKNIRKFYLMCKGGMILTSSLTWSHYVELLRLDSIDEINNYILITTEKHLSVRQLRLKIKIYKTNNNYTN